jgi:hypothetical protein
VLTYKDGTPVPSRYEAFVFSAGCLAARWEAIHDWRELYLAALLEVDPTKLRQKIDIALAAIQARKQQHGSSERLQERQAIRDATSALRTLLKDLSLR